jgi:hypothetical protein
MIRSCAEVMTCSFGNPVLVSKLCLPFEFGLQSKRCINNRHASSNVGLGSGRQFFTPRFNFDGAKVSTE